MSEYRYSFIMTENELIKYCVLHSLYKFGILLYFCVKIAYIKLVSLNNFWRRVVDIIMCLIIFVPFEALENSFTLNHVKNQISKRYDNSAEEKFDKKLVTFSYCYNNVHYFTNNNVHYCTYNNVLYFTYNNNIHNFTLLQ